MIEKRNLYQTQDYDVPFRHPKKLHARAIYDNIADSPEELAFKKGDILNVIEQDPDGLIGWWLCTLRGRQGLCPGNRLRIINSYDSGCFTPSPSSSPSPSLGASTASVSSADIYDTSTLRSGKRRSWSNSQKVITPQKCGDVYLYDISSSSRSSPYQNLSIMSDPEAYDVPRPAVHIQSNYDCPKPHVKDTNHRQAQPDDSYDTPRPATSLSQQNMTPSSSNSSLMTPDNLSLSSSNRSSLANMPDYDIPRRNAPPIRTHTPQQPNSLNSQSTYDFPQQSQRLLPSNNGQDKSLPLVTKELPLELGSALETLAKLQNEATTAVMRLLAFVIPNWRSREKLEPVLMDIKLSAVRLKTALHDLAEFGEGTLGNASRSEDKSLAHKLKPLVKALRDADKLVHEVSQTLEAQGWTLENLSRKEQKSCSSQPPDSLDQLIACAQTLTEDVRLSASFIQGNATLLFKRVPQTPTNPPSNNNNSSDGEWIEDNDYVSLESKDAAAKKNSELREAIPQNLKKKFDNAIKAAEDTAINADKIELNANDKLLIKYYAVQISTHMGYLLQAIDSFLETVEKNQPPKFFIAYGKFVVLSAHNLVSIGDIIHRNISRDDIKSQVQKCTDGLSDALRTCVQKSKKAAQHFPSVNAVQEMVDSVVDISHLASDLKVAVLQSVQI